MTRDGRDYCRVGGWDFLRVGGGDFYAGRGGGMSEGWVGFCLLLVRTLDYLTWVLFVISWVSSGSGVVVYLFVL